MTSTGCERLFLENPHDTLPDIDAVHATFTLADNEVPAHMDFDDAMHGVVRGQALAKSSEPHLSGPLTESPSFVL